MLKYFNQSESESFEGALRNLDTEKRCNLPGSGIELNGGDLAVNESQERCQGIRRKVNKITSGEILAINVSASDLRINHIPLTLRLHEVFFIFVGATFCINHHHRGILRDQNGFWLYDGIPRNKLVQINNSDPLDWVIYRKGEENEENEDGGKKPQNK